MAASCGTTPGINIGSLISALQPPFQQTSASAASAPTAPTQSGSVVERVVARMAPADVLAILTGQTLESLPQLSEEERSGLQEELARLDREIEQAKMARAWDEAQPNRRIDQVVRHITSREQIRARIKELGGRLQGELMQGVLAARFQVMYPGQAIPDFRCLYQFEDVDSPTPPPNVINIARLALRLAADRGALDVAAVPVIANLMRPIQLDNQLSSIANGHFSLTAPGIIRIAARIAFEAYSPGIMGELRQFVKTLPDDQSAAKRLIIQHNQNRLKALHNNNDPIMCINHYTAGNTAFNLLDIKLNELWRERQAFKAAWRESAASAAPPQSEPMAALFAFRFRAMFQGQILPDFSCIYKYKKIDGPVPPDTVVDIARLILHLAVDEEVRTPEKPRSRSYIEKRDEFLSIATQIVFDRYEANQPEELRQLAKKLPEDEVEAKSQISRYVFDLIETMKNSPGIAALPVKNSEVERIVTFRLKQALRRLWEKRPKMQGRL